MSGTFPATIGITKFKLESRTPTMVSITQSGRRDVRQVGGQRWVMSGTMATMSQSDYKEYFAFMASQNGRYEAFSFVSPDMATPEGVATGTPLVVGAHSLGDTTISTDGWTTTVTGIMKAGDLIKFAGHNKVYIVTADANSVAGATTLTIFPALLETLANNEGITVSSVPFTVMMQNDNFDYNVSAPTNYSQQIAFIEVI